MLLLGGCHKKKPDDSTVTADPVIIRSAEQDAPPADAAEDTPPADVEEGHQQGGQDAPPPPPLLPSPPPPLLPPSPPLLLLPQSQAGQLLHILADIAKSASVNNDFIAKYGLSFAPLDQLAWNYNIATHIYQIVRSEGMMALLKGLSQEQMGALQLLIDLARLRMYNIQYSLRRINGTIEAYDNDRFNTYVATQKNIQAATI